MRTTRKTLGLLITLAVVLALAGCGEPASNQPAAEKLVIGVSSIPTTLDPDQHYRSAQIGVFNLVKGTLVNLDPDGSGVSMGLAASIQPGRDRFVVKLKPNLKFSDGSPLTATDVAASFDFYMQDKTNGYASDFVSIAKVTAVDDLTVNFDLKYPYPSLPFVLSSHAVIPSKSIEAKGTSAESLYAGDPLPTAGKFGVQSLTKDQIILRANPNYAGPQPSVKTLTFKQIIDPNTRLAQVQGGQLDYAYKIPVKQVGQLSGLLEARSVQTFGTNFLLMNNRPSSLLSDVRIRKAISLAIDRNQINQVAYEGHAPPALGLFPKISEFHDPFASPDPDVAGAKELLAGTECANGCTLESIALSDAQEEVDAATVVQQNLKAIGIDARIRMTPGAVYDEDLSKGNFDIALSSLYTTTGAADGWLFWSVETYFADFAGYSSPEIEQLEPVLRSAQGSTLAAAVSKANAIFERDLPFTPAVGLPSVSVSRVPTKLFGTDPTLNFYVG